MLKLMYITNNQNIAKIAQKSGVDWIFVDLEKIGKIERQKGFDTVISNHSLSDVKSIKDVLRTSKLLVRINPINANSKTEIDAVISYGADIVMLPFFTNAKEVRIFIDYVDRRSKTCLLVETPEAVKDIDAILDVKDIDYIHIGLNDLHLGLKMKFMFELLADGTVEKLCKKIEAKKIPFGFGGVGRIGAGTLPANLILSEHYRLGSSMVILSRSFFQADSISNEASIESIYQNEINKIRKYEKDIQNKTSSFFEDNKKQVMDEVIKIVDSMR